MNSIIKENLQRVVFFWLMIQVKGEGGNKKTHFFLYSEKKLKIFQTHFTKTMNQYNMLTLFLIAFSVFRFNSGFKEKKS